MKKTTFTFVFSVVSIVLYSSAIGAVLDQKQESYSGLTAFCAERYLAQTFVPSISGKLDHIEIFIDRDKNKQATVSIVETTATGEPSGATLGSVTVASWTVDYDWATIDFSAENINLTSGTEYAIVLAGTGAWGDWDYWAADGCGNLYPQGEIWEWTPSGGWAPSGFCATPGLTDATFRTYMASEVTDCVPDQKQESYTGLTAFCAERYLAQTFVPSISGRLDHIEIFIDRDKNKQATVSIVETTATGEPSGATLGSVTVASWSVDYDWATIDLSAENINLTSGTKYAIVLAGTGVWGDWDYWAADGCGNLYPQGEIWEWTPAGGWAPSGFCSTPGLTDATFRTCITEVTGCVPDQKQESYSGLTAFCAERYLAQTFVPSMSGRLDHIEVFIDRDKNKQATVSIVETTTAGEPSGVTLGSVNVTSWSVDYDWETIDFSAENVNLTAGKRYAIVLVGTGAWGDWDKWAADGCGNLYPQGEIWEWTPAAGWAKSGFCSTPGLTDATFRTCIGGEQCGDDAHPYPVGDVNKDCRVNFFDIAEIASHWLECTDLDCE